MPTTRAPSVVVMKAYYSDDLDELSGYDSDINNDDDFENETLFSLKKLKAYNNMTEEERVLSALACAEDPFEKIDHFLYSSTFSEEEEEDLRKYCATAPPSVFQYRPSVYSYDSDQGLSYPARSFSVDAQDDKTTPTLFAQPSLFYNSSPEGDFNVGINMNCATALAAPLASDYHSGVEGSCGLKDEEVDRTLYVKNLSSVDKATLLEALKIMAPDVVESMKTKKKRGKKGSFEETLEIIDNNAKSHLKSVENNSFKTTHPGPVITHQDGLGLTTYPLSRPAPAQLMLRLTSAFKNNQDPWINSGSVKEFNRKARKESVRKLTARRDSRIQNRKETFLQNRKENNSIDSLPFDKTLPPLYFEEVLEWCQFDDNDPNYSGAEDAQSDKYFAVSSHTNGYWDDSCNDEPLSQGKTAVGSEAKEWMYATLFDDALAEYGDEFWYFDTLIKNESSGASSDDEMLYIGGTSLVPSSSSSAGEDDEPPHKKHSVVKTTMAALTEK